MEKIDVAKCSKCSRNYNLVKIESKNIFLCIDCLEEYKQNGGI